MSDGRVTAGGQLPRRHVGEAIESGQPDRPVFATMAATPTGGLEAACPWRCTNARNG